MTTKIEWTDETWNPIVGCSRISPGCRGCYAARMAKRQAGMARAKRAQGKDPGRSAHYEKVENWDGVALVPEALGDPLKWRKARRVFVCSMSDLFHEDVSFSYVREIWDKMHNASRHTFQILTKRPARMLDFLTGEWLPGRGIEYPLLNVHLGVTICNASELWKITPLRDTPAVKRFISFEPLLQPINPNLDDIDQVIVGAETGPGKRPMKLDWARSLRDQCQAADVPFFFKKDSRGNRELDGRLWEQMPR